MTDEEKPYRPVWGNDRYAALKEAKQEITARRELFSINITASTEQKGGIMESNQQQPTNFKTKTSKVFSLDIVFKPVEPGLKLRTEETELLLAHLGEILQEIEAEEQLLTAKDCGVKNGNSN